MTAVAGHPSAPPRALFAALCVLVCVSFVSGGSSQHSGLDDAFAQLLALPVLLVAAWAISREGLAGPAWLGLGAMLLIVLVPLLQLLPLPSELWRWPQPRMALERDLLIAGASDLQHRWTLAPAATERALLSLLPALAAFLGALALGARAQRGLMRLLIGLALSSLLLGIAQLGAGRDSLLNPFPQWDPAMGGVFANPNHQATALAVALVLSVALLLDARRRARSGDGWRGSAWVFAGLAGLMLLALPATGSRAGLIIALPGVAAVIATSGTLGMDRLHSSWKARVALPIVVGIVIVCTLAALGWMRVDATQETRGLLTKVTIGLGWAHAPLGSGMGSFVPVFEQDGPSALLGSEYINHAHNDFAQWWLEAGVPALVAALGVLLAAAAALHRLFGRGSSQAQRALPVAALIALGVMLAHSLVDYPLRTPALMTVAGLLAGMALSTRASGAKPPLMLRPVGPAAPLPP